MCGRRPLRRAVKASEFWALVLANSHPIPSDAQTSVRKESAKCSCYAGLEPRREDYALPRGRATGATHRSYSTELTRSQLPRSGFLYISADFAQQFASRCRNVDVAVEDFVAVYIVTIHGLVSALIGLHDGAVQAHSRENAFGA